MFRTIAIAASYIFHPLLMVTYMLVLLLWINPYLFGVHSIRGQMPLLFIIFMSTFTLPVVAVLMMKQLEMVDSFQLTDRQERTGPYISTGILYIATCYIAYTNNTIPTAFTVFVMGSTFALFVAFIINLFSKISLHAIGMGGLVGMVLLTLFNYSYGYFAFTVSPSLTFAMSMNHLVILVLFIAGLVGTSRLYLRAHDPQDICRGYLVGFSMQLLAFVMFS